jgi:hypothetical protein
VCSVLILLLVLVECVVCSVLILLLVLVNYDKEGLLID